MAMRRAGSQLGHLCRRAAGQGVSSTSSSLGEASTSGSCSTSCSSAWWRSFLTAAAPRGYVQRWEDVNNRDVEPFGVVQHEVESISERLRHSVSTSIPALRVAAEYFFRKGVEGKRLRPTLVMLFASALSESAPSAEYLQADLRPPAEHPPELRRRQQRIAEVAELIHVASLLHDDVIDDASTRRGVTSLNSMMGNKTAILAGDFLLARASVTLASLRQSEVVELMSQVLESLVSGEIMQMTATQTQLLDLEHYLAKSYCKTASLMANSLRSVAVLSGATPQVCQHAWDYGRHLGLAFQVVDDVLDLTASSSILGKPALNDLRSGLATAPALYAAQDEPGMQPLILRRFKQDGDVQAALAYIDKAHGIQRAKDLAKRHCQLAADAICSLPPAQSDHAEIAREALLKLTQKVLNRSK